LAFLPDQGASVERRPLAPFDICGFPLKGQKKERGKRVKNDNRRLADTPSDSVEGWKAKASELETAVAADVAELSKLQARRGELASAAFINGEAAALKEWDAAVAAETKLNARIEGQRIAIKHCNEQIAGLLARAERKEAEARAIKARELAKSIIETAGVVDNALRSTAAAFERLSADLTRLRQEVGDVIPARLMYDGFKAQAAIAAGLSKALEIPRHIKGSTTVEVVEAGMSAVMRASAIDANGQIEFAGDTASGGAV
jgi:hypothetical protein